MELEEEKGPLLSKRFQDDKGGGEVDYKSKAGTAWSHNFLNQKPWHPLSYQNQRRKWIAEQTHAQRERRADEVAREYAQEQEFFRQTALISKKEKEKVETMKAVSFMYVRPPGYDPESAKAAEIADEMRKNNQQIEGPSTSSSVQPINNGGAVRDSEGKRKRRPKDLYGRTLPTEEEFEVLKNAPKMDTGIIGRARPFGIELRNVKCLRCGTFGHQSGDRECPLKDAIMPNEEKRLQRDDPLNAIIAQGDTSEPLKWELKQQPGLSPPRGGFNPDDPNQQIVAEEIFDEYGGFLEGGVIPDLLANFTAGGHDKKRSKRKSKHKKRSKASESETSMSGSDFEEKRSKSEKKKHKKKSKSERHIKMTRNQLSDFDEDDKGTRKRNSESGNHIKKGKGRNFTTHSVPDDEDYDKGEHKGRISKGTEVVRIKSREENMDSDGDDGREGNHQKVSNWRSKSNGDDRVQHKDHLLSSDEGDQRNYKGKHSNRHAEFDGLPRKCQHSSHNGPPSECDEDNRKSKGCMRHGKHRSSQYHSDSDADERNEYSTRHPSNADERSRHQQDSKNRRHCYKDDHGSRTEHKYTSRNEQSDKHYRSKSKGRQPDSTEDRSNSREDRYHHPENHRDGYRGRRH